MEFTERIKRIVQGLCAGTHSSAMTRAGRNGAIRPEKEASEDRQAG
jgi:hypothetical protein